MDGVRINDSLRQRKHRRRHLGTGCSQEERVILTPAVGFTAGHSCTKCKPANDIGSETAPEYCAFSAKKVACAKFREAERMDDGTCLQSLEGLLGLYQFSRDFLGSVAFMECAGEGLPTTPAF